MNAKANTPSAAARLLALNPQQLANDIKRLGKDLGFTQVRIAHPDTPRAAMHFKRWQALNNAGDMHYLQRHGLKRGHIHTITPQAFSIISVSLNYLPLPVAEACEALDNDQPYISVYARGRDYHKVMRKMLAKFAKAIENLVEKRLKTRAFVDTAPVLDKAYAEQSGLGWVGKHTNILDRRHGSFYFLGELAVNLKLPPDHPVTPRCGSCTSCLDVCPTQAITAPYQLDAQRCISYLTIEHDGIIADEFKPLIGNRIYGCDDCQLFCPWNRYAKLSKKTDFYAMKKLGNPDFGKLFALDEQDFLRWFEGSPIRRIGHARWQRNLAIGMGNSNDKEKYYQILKQNRHPHPAVQDAVKWALSKLL